MDYRTEVLETIRKLAALPRLAEGTAATLLGRRAELRSEDPFQVICDLAGGPTLPWVRVHEMWMRKLDKRKLTLDVAPEVRLEKEAFLNELRLSGPTTRIRPDPKMIRQPDCVAVRIPLGEIRLIFSSYKKNARLETVILSEVPVVAWGPNDVPVPP